MPEDLRERMSAALEDLLRRNGWDGERNEQVDRETAEILDTFIAVTDGELGRLRNRITALEASGAELWRSLDIADERIERVRAQHRQDDPEDPMCRHCRMTWPCPTIRTLDGAHSFADAPSPVTAATEAHGETTEAQEG